MAMAMAMTPTWLCCNLRFCYIMMILSIVCIGSVLILRKRGKNTNTNTYTSHITNLTSL